MIWFALHRLRADWRDIGCLLSVLEMPLLYLLGFRGQLKTVVGKILVTDRTVLRASIYGIFKSYFCYLRILSKLLPSGFGQTVVDVGANMGDFTLAIERQRPGRLVAIEPGKRNFRVLQSNLALNGVSDAILLNVAAHDREETVHFHGTNSNLHIDSSRNGQPVQGIPLDGIMDKLGIEEVDIVKVDVQGHEKPVLMGMHNLLSKGAVKFLIVEVHLKRNVRFEEIVSLMRSYGYHLVHMDSYLFEQPHLCFTTNGNSMSRFQTVSDNMN